MSADKNILNEEIVYRGAFVDPCEHFELYLEVGSDCAKKEYAFTLELFDGAGAGLHIDSKWQFSRLIGRHFVYNPSVVTKSVVRLPSVELGSPAANFVFSVRPWRPNFLGSLAKFGSLNIVAVASSASHEAAYSNLLTIEADGRHGR